MFRLFRNFMSDSRTRAIITEIKETCVAYFKAQLILLLVNVTVITSGLLLLSMKWWALPIAIGISLVDLLPVLGSGAVFVPWIIYSFYVSDTKMAVGLIILFVIVLVLKLLLEPLVCGKKIGLSGLETFGASISGLVVFGSSGIIVGPLLAVSLKIIMKHVQQQR